MTRTLSPATPARRFSNPGELLISRAIGLARLICILGIVYVHGWTGVSGEAIAARAGSPAGILRWTLVELFGRSAVPLLSIISGWLVVQTLAKRRADRFILGKARALLVPLLLWNLIAVVLVTGAAALGLPDTPHLGDGAWLADNLLALTRAGDINVQTAFLRDLFLCMLAAPLLVRLPTPALLLLIAALAVWVIAGWQLTLLLRPAILLFFIAGILARRHALAERCGALPIWTVLLPFFSIITAKTVLESPALIAAADLAVRASAALLVWRAAMALAWRRAGARLLVFERYAFVLFCSHLLFMWLVAPLIGRLAGPFGSPGWPLFFVVQPLLALGFAILLALAIERVSPRAAALLSGGRLR